MAKLGSITVNEIEIAEIDASPIGDATLDLATGSIAVLTDGTQMWHKNATGVNGWQPIGSKNYVGLGNVDNTSDANKPISTAEQTALNLKANLSGGNSLTGNQTVTSGFIGVGKTPTQLLDMEAPTTASASVRAVSTTGVSFFDFKNDSNQYLELGIYGTASNQTLFGDASLGKTFILGAAGPMVMGNFTSQPIIFGTAAAARLKIETTGELNTLNNDILNTLTGLSTSNTVIAATDSIRTAIGKAQGQISATITSLSGKANLAGGNTFTGDQTIGPAGAALTNNPLSVNGTVNSFLQSNVQNTQAGTTASSDIVATADNGTDTTNFVDLGINSSALSDATWTINGVNDAYLYSGTTNLSIGTAAAKYLSLFTGGTLAANERLRINNTGQVIIGGTSPVATSLLQLDSTTQGFLLPRMTWTQILAIATPVAGLQVYSSDSNVIVTYDGTSWQFEDYYRTTAIQSSTSATYANITELVTGNLPIGTYQFYFTGIAQSTNIGEGIGFRLAASTATIGTISINWLISQAANGTAQNFQYNQLTAATNVSSASTSVANQDFPISGSGIFTVTATGSIAIQLRAETGISVSIRPNSVLKIAKVS